ncbi:MAG: cell division protein FtsA [Lachnospiraceae bacterium]|nr:cell division protein FtsA [Lachnospiraceae bacterium]
MAEKKAAESKKTAESRRASDGKKYPGQLVYGLDIGTRSIVGTVGYMYNKIFHVVAIESKPHETRAMQDGQIHNIAAVAESITEVTSRLQIKLGRPLHEVCIAAAGRVLRTVTVHVEQELGEARDVNNEDIYSLELLGAQRAYERFLKESTLNLKFYCVGYTVQKYYLDKYPMSDLLAHKGSEIGADVIATFLPDEVVDGLYKAVQMSGLHVADLTLEPIAAMEVAIPQNFRMLNLALVDVGAGTSDISITRDESIVAYGMIPSAGDELTEAVAKHYLTDFDQAEHIKYEASKGGEFTYKDIMGIERKTSGDEVRSVVADTINVITRETSDQIKKLNGGKPVSAIFVVGGGGRMPGYTESLAKEMGIDPTRVAVRGEDVLKDIDFKDKSLPTDSLIVTPVGICLNFFRQRNNFIFVSFNNVQYKLYDNNKLKVMDAAIQAGFANADLFPKRGAEITYTVNGEKRVVRGETGEGALIKLNGEEASLNTAIKAGDLIEVTPSTAGAPAHLSIEELPEYTESLRVIFNGNEVSVPKFAEVNGELKSGYYEVKDGDVIQMRNYVTVTQLLSFLDVRSEQDSDIMINHVPSEGDTKVYENFTVDILIDDTPYEPSEEDYTDPDEAVNEDGATGEAAGEAGGETEGGSAGEKAGESADKGRGGVESAGAAPAGTTPAPAGATAAPGGTTPASAGATAGPSGTIPAPAGATAGPAGAVPRPQEKKEEPAVIVIVNDKPVTLTGKNSYVFVDVFDHIDFDLSKPHGKMVVTKKNGMRAEYSEGIKDGDRLEIYWEK